MRLTQPQLNLAGDWAELGKTWKKKEHTTPQLDLVESNNNGCGTVYGKIKNNIVKTAIQ